MNISVAKTVKAGHRESTHRVEVEAPNVPVAVFNELVFQVVDSLLERLDGKEVKSNDGLKKSESV